MSEGEGLTSQAAERYVAISGGVGGAKLSLGLVRILRARLTVIVNTGDDFEHMGLHVSPDIDTALYTLADLVNPDTGWGRRDETWTFMESTKGLGGETWFRLGDADLALHVERTRRLRGGEPLSSICSDIARRLGIDANVVPMSDDPVRTILETDRGRLEFQHYFVREQCRPVVKAIRFEGGRVARPAAAAVSALEDPSLAGVIICPSNPYLSVDPILAVPGLKEALRNCRAPIIAVSPIVGGMAIKGPTAKIMGELGIASDARSIARHYEGLIDGFVLDTADTALQNAVNVPVHVTQTVMRTLEDKMNVAKACLAFCGALAAQSGRSARTP